MQEFNKKGIIEFLQQKSVCDCMDIRTLSNHLGTISPRMIRKHTTDGNLKPINNNVTMYVYRCEDIADWLLLNPRYFFKREESQFEITDEKFKSLCDIIRRLVLSHWRNTLLKVMDMDDICSTVIYKILKKRYNGRVTDSVLIYRELVKLWEKESKRRDTTTYDPLSFQGTNIAATEEED